MSKLILMLAVSVLTANTNGKTILNNAIRGMVQKEAGVIMDTIKVPYTLYNEGMGSVSDNVDSSKINFSKQFVIIFKGEVAATGARLNVKSLILKNKTLTLTYKLGITGKALSPDSPRPFFFALLVDKKYKGEIKLVEL